MDITIIIATGGVWMDTAGTGTGNILTCTDSMDTRSMDGCCIYKYYIVSTGSVFIWCPRYRYYIGHWKCMDGA